MGKTLIGHGGGRNNGKTLSFRKEGERFRVAPSFENVAFHATI